MTHLIIPRVVTKLMLPYILLYALYVQFHGDYSPGGGFQAGVIFGSGFILYTLIFGVETAQQVAPPAERTPCSIAHQRRRTVCQ